MIEIEGEQTSSRSKTQERKKRKLTHSPSPSTSGLVGSTEDRLSNVSADPDVDDTGNRGEDGPEETVAKGRNIGDDDVL